MQHLYIFLLVLKYIFHHSEIPYAIMQHHKYICLNIMLQHADKNIHDVEDIVVYFSCEIRMLQN
jgi:hypothetical protein